MYVRTLLQESELADVSFRYCVDDAMVQHRVRYNSVTEDVVVSAARCDQLKTLALNGMKDVFKIYSTVCRCLHVLSLSNNDNRDCNDWESKIVYSELNFSSTFIFVLCSTPPGKRQDEISTQLTIQKSRTSRYDNTQIGGYLVDT